MQTFSRSTSRNSKLRMEFEESAFDQLMGLVEGIRSASIFKLSCSAEEETENHAVFLLLQLAFM